MLACQAAMPALMDPLDHEERFDRCRRLQNCVGHCDGCTQVPAQLAVVGAVDGYSCIGMSTCQSVLPILMALRKFSLLVD
jgi:hypothetical protein